ncbi:hypothetical protein SO802_008201 [Lithocarpus litseifolius]|uniref:Clu domain-containing protein n=1 Tax=Lithocarpus litseifolius TaxID=425828 RepID=A0AAW2DAS0_9ROSI
MRKRRTPLVKWPKEKKKVVVRFWRNCLDVDSHELFTTIDHLLEETDMTPADVAENLMPKSQNEDAETCLKKLIEAIKTAKEEATKKAEEEARLKAEKEEKEKQEATQEDVKVDESLAKDVKENGVDVVKDDKTLGKESVFPGILQGDKSDSLLYGSVDNGKKICWNDDFHSKVLGAAEHLHLKEHTVLDGSGNFFKLAAPVEFKGIVGSDDSQNSWKIILVGFKLLRRLFEVVLRILTTLITAFCQAQAAERSKFKSEGDAHVTTDSSTVVGVNEQFVQDLCTLEVSPMDGQTLTEALHAHGINVRYIGKVADGTKHLPHLWDLCSNEIVVRSAKHILKDVLRDIEDHDIAPAISHFFNCFFGSVQAVGSKVAANNMQSRTHKKDQGSHQSSGKPSKGQGRFKGGASARKNQSSFMNLSSETPWSNIQEFAKLKYQFELPKDTRSRVKKVSVIQNLCQKSPRICYFSHNMYSRSNRNGGITIAARKYDFNSAAPYQTSDILNLQPVMKHSVPLCSEAKDLVEMDKIQSAEGMPSEAYTLFSESFSILQQVAGPMHQEVANCCRYLAMVLYHAGDMAGAIMQQHKELIINEWCLGLDHPDTAHGHALLFFSFVLMH